MLFLRKELSDLRSNKQVWPAYVLPIVAVALTLILLIALPSLTESARAGNDAGARMILETVLTDPSLRGVTVEERLARLLLRKLGLFYLLMPVMLASSAAALALVREKEQRTLEPILATPLRDRDLLLAKLIAAVVPALLVTWAAAVVGISAGVLGSVWRVGQIILPTTGTLVGLLLLAPAMATVAALAGLRASARFTDVPGAMQFTGLVVMPLCLVLVALVGRPAMRWPVAGSWNDSSPGVGAVVVQQKPAAIQTGGNPDEVALTPGIDRGFTGTVKCQNVISVLRTPFHPRRPDRHSRDGDSQHLRLPGEELPDHIGGHMSLDHIASDQGGMTRDEIAPDLVARLDRRHVGGVLDRYVKAALPHDLDPFMAAAAVRILVHHHRCTGGSPEQGGETTTAAAAAAPRARRAAGDGFTHGLKDNSGPPAVSRPAVQPSHHCPPR